MDEKKWYGNRITFFINEKREIVFQELEDIHSCRDWLKEDYGFTDEEVNGIYRGQIIYGEIAFFIGEAYSMVPETVISEHLFKCIRQHDFVFGRRPTGIEICNGKVPAVDYSNWEPRVLLGTWISVPEDAAFS